MIPAGLLDRLRLRARCYALRVRTVDELEQQRDDARGRARAAEVERDQAVHRAERAEQAVDRAKGELRNYGHRPSSDPYDLWHDVDNALNAERVKRDHARQAADAWRPATASPRDAYDPAMGGDIEPPPGRPERTEVPF